MKSIVSLCAAVTLLLSGCTNLERSLIFATHTTTGVEIAAGAGSTEPLTVVIGYKRSEAVINPVYDSSGIDETQKKYRDEAYSVIAKLVGDVSGKATANIEAQAGISGAQWFATGEAAKIIAAQPGIAGAVTGSPAIAEAATHSSSLDEFGGVPVFRLLQEVYRLMGDAKTAVGSSSAHHHAQLDAFAERVVPEKFDFTPYRLEGNHIGRSALVDEDLKVPGDGFFRVRQYHDVLTTSIKDLTGAISTEEAKPAGTNSKLTKEERVELISELHHQRNRLTAFENAVVNAPEVVAAIQYFARHLFE